MCSFAKKYIQIFLIVNIPTKKIFVKNPQFSVVHVLGDRILLKNTTNCKQITLHVNSEYITIIVLNCHILTG